MVTVQRDGAIEVTRAEGNATPAVVRMSVSSETPCLCYRWWNDQYQRVYEILDHGPDAIDRARIADGLVIRDQHYGDQVALIPQPVLAGGKLGGAVEWCSGARAQELRQDCEKKLRRNVSVEGIVDPTSYRLDGDQGGIPLVRAMRWTPLAAALVSAAPADPTVGVGRTITPPNIVTRKEPAMAEETPKPITMTADSAAEIFTLARQHNVDPECTMDALKRGITPQAFGMEILSRKAAIIQPKPVTPGTLPDVLTPKEAKKFSLHRAIEAVDPKSGYRGNSFEREVSDEIARIMGKPAQGFYVPNEAFRTMSVVGANGDGALVSTELMAGSFIEMLRAAVCINALGVTRLLGMVGDVSVPKQLTGQTYYHVGRDASVTASDATFGLVKASPHTIGARTIVGRSMLKQSSINAEALTQQSIVAAMAEGMDVKAFSGVGGNEPAGLKLATDINAATVTSAGSATWANILTFLSTISADNVQLASGMKWAMPTNVLFNLAGIPKVSGQSEMLAKEGPNGWTVAGYPVVISNNVPAKHAFFGAWAEFVWVTWGAVDIAVNPYTYDSQGAVAITALQDYDHMVRHGQAFSYNATVIA